MIDLGMVALSETRLSRIFVVFQLLQIFTGLYIYRFMFHEHYRFTTAVFVSLPLGAAMLGIGGMGIEQCNPNVKQVCM